MPKLYCRRKERMTAGSVMEKAEGEYILRRSELRKAWLAGRFSAESTAPGHWGQWPLPFYDAQFGLFTLERGYLTPGVGAL